MITINKILLKRWSKVNNNSDFQTFKYYLSEVHSYKQLLMLLYHLNQQ